MSEHRGVESQRFALVVRQHRQPFPSGRIVIVTSFASLRSFQNAQ
jgi:hypothetical protein